MIGRGSIQSASSLLSDRATPEKRLLLHILKRAANDFMGHYHTDSKSNDDMEQDARRWFNRKIKERLEPWSFAWVCQMLDLDPKAVRQRLENLKKELSPDDGSKRLTTIEVHEIDFVYRFYDESTDSSVKVAG